MGDALRDMLNFGDAINAHRRAAELFARTRDWQRQAAVLNNLGDALRSVRNYEEAISVYRRAAALFGETGDRHYLGVVLNNLRCTLQQTGELDASVKVGEALDNLASPGMSIELRLIAPHLDHDTER